MNIGPLFRRRKGPRLLVRRAFANPPAPFAQYNWDYWGAQWGAQRGAQRGASDVVINLLLCTLAATIPFQAIDWPAPKIPVRLAQYEQVPNLLTTTLADSFTNAPRTPFFTQKVSTVTLREDQQANLLLTTLATTQNPFSSTDWTNPVLRKAIQQEQAQNLLLTTLATTQNPLLPYEWPKPQQYKYRIEETPSNLRNTLYAVTQSPFFNFDWSRPQVSQYKLNEPSINWILRAPATLGVPFSNPDWSRLNVPKIVQQSQYNRTVTTSTSVVPRSTAFTQRIPYRVVREDPQANISPALLAKPFNQYDWSRPNSYSYRIVREEAQTSLSPALFTVPFNQYNWPKPNLLVTRNDWISLNLTIAISTPVIPVGPPIQVMATTGVSQNLYTLTPQPDGHYTLTINPAVGS